MAGMMVLFAILQSRATHGSAAIAVTIAAAAAAAKAAAKATAQITPGPGRRGERLK